MAPTAALRPIADPADKGPDWVDVRPVNTEAKLLMLTHAFETLGMRRVEFKTDNLNVASRRAIARLGAREEGILREHIVTESGRIRDTVYFSILRVEWPDVRAALRDRLSAE